MTLARYCVYYCVGLFQMLKQHPQHLHRPHLKCAALIKMTYKDIYVTLRLLFPARVAAQIISAMHSELMNRIYPLLMKPSHIDVNIWHMKNCAIISDDYTVYGRLRANIIMQGASQPHEQLNRSHARPLRAADLGLVPRRRTRDHWPH